MSPGFWLGIFLIYLELGTWGESGEYMWSRPSDSERCGVVVRASRLLFYIFQVKRNCFDLIGLHLCSTVLPTNIVVDHHPTLSFFAYPFFHFTNTFPASSPWWYQQTATLIPAVVSLTGAQRPEDCRQSRHLQLKPTRRLRISFDYTAKNQNYWSSYLWAKCKKTVDGQKKRSYVAKRSIIFYKKNNTRQHRRHPSYNLSIIAALCRPCLLSWTLTKRLPYHIALPRLQAHRLGHHGRHRNMDLLLHQGNGMSLWPLPCFTPLLPTDCYRQSCKLIHYQKNLLLQWSPQVKKSVSS